jgi:hypothetical protein
MTPQQAGSAYVSFMHSTGSNDWREVGYMTQPRVFSLEGDFHYEGSPHNEPKYGDAELVMPDLCIAHWREQKTNKEDQRNDRTRDIVAGLKKSIEDMNYTGAEESFKVMDSFRRHYMVAKLCTHLQDFKQALEFCEKAFVLYLQLGDREKARMVSYLLLGAGINFRLGKLLDVAKYAAKHRAYCGPCADNSFYGFAYFQAAGDPIMALDYGREYLQCVETDRLRPIWHCETFEQWDDVLLRVELTEYWLQNKNAKIDNPDNCKLLV